MNKKHAQSPLEYAMIIIAVITSIMVMGPYVVRGVNAYMRSWEISAEQASRDTSVRLEAWEVPGALPAAPVNCGHFSLDNEEGCKAAVGEDGSRCWWWQEYVVVASDNPGDCEVFADKCVDRGSSTFGYTYTDGCTMDHDYCDVTNDEECSGFHF